MSCSANVDQITHPTTKHACVVQYHSELPWYGCVLQHMFSVAAQYVLLGAEEGLFSLLVIPNNPDPVMEQVIVYMHMYLHVFACACMRNYVIMHCGIGDHYP